MGKKSKNLRGTVERVIEPITPTQPEKAEIGIEKADDLHREIRIENVVTDEKGEKARLKPGAKVDLVVEADSDATTKLSMGEPTKGAQPLTDGQDANEFAALQEQQWEALDRAIYVGMTSREAQEYERRARRITELQRALGINLDIPHNRRERG